jgi:hypothetical protein
MEGAQLHGKYGSLINKYLQGKEKMVLYQTRLAMQCNAATKLPTRRLHSQGCMQAKRNEFCAGKKALQPTLLTEKEEEESTATVSA